MSLLTGVRGLLGSGRSLERKRHSRAFVYTARGSRAVTWLAASAGLAAWRGGTVSLDSPGVTR